MSSLPKTMDHGGRHRMIVASAGTGKTYRLALRYLELLAEGAQPAQITALTFTRKAAGEFTERILGRLAEASLDARKAAQLAGELGLERRGPEGFNACLSNLVTELPRLTLGTLDSFFNRIGAVFPLELGLSPGFTLMEAEEEEMARSEALEEMVELAARKAESMGHFLEVFKRATLGNEEKNIARLLLDRMRNWHGRWLEVPPAARRLSPEAVIADRDWLTWKPGRPEAALEAVLRWTRTTPPTHAKQGEWLTAIAEAVSGWEPGQSMPLKIEKLLDNEHLHLTGTGENLRVTSIKYYKEITLDDAAKAAWGKVLRWMCGSFFHRHHESLGGFLEILSLFESSYDRRVRRRGKLTFADLTRRLDSMLGWIPEGMDAEARAEASAQRLQIDYRLDSKYCHWLLDEFQDTSRAQWRVLANLLDEVLQDAEGERSLFVVGDPKQSIYEWRGGDPRLMEEIYEEKQTPIGPMFARTSLGESQRSGEAVMAAVNACFDTDQTAHGIWDQFQLDRAAVIEPWQKIWTTHSVAPRNVAAKAGVAMVVGVAGEARDEVKPAKVEWMVRLLREIQPLERGYTCAILLRTNAECREVYELLRAAGIANAALSAETSPAADNVVGQTFLSLLGAVWHPQNSLARHHLAMCPWGEEWATPEGAAQARANWRKVWAAQGPVGFVERYVAQATGRLADGDQFNRDRAGVLLELAARFAAEEDWDPGRLEQFLESHRRRQHSSPFDIQIMSIHQAKGLGFDIVILPEWNAWKLFDAEDGLFPVHLANDPTPTGLYQFPRKFLHGLDAGLKAAVERSRQAGALQNLCLLYVAMTRAARGLYMVVNQRKSDKSDGKRDPLVYELAVECLGAASPQSPGAVPIRMTEGGETPLETILHQNGDPGWWKGGQPEPRIPSAPLMAWTGLAGPPLMDRITAIRPSVANYGEAHLNRLVDRSRFSREFGLAVHRLMQDCEWCADELIAGWKRQAGMEPDPVKRQALEEAARIMREPAVAAVMRRPEETVELWREQAFEAMLDERRWVSGVFDRVVLWKEGPAAEARYVRAHLIDFKTDRWRDGKTATEAARRYENQLQLYREALQLLTGLLPQDIRVSLVFTAVGAVVEMAQ